MKNKKKNNGKEERNRQRRISTRNGKAVAGTERGEKNWESGKSYNKKRKEEL